MTTEELTIHLTEQNKTLARIETAVLATNGRVRTLELWQARLKGGLAMLVVVGPLLGALVAPHIGL